MYMCVGVCVCVCVCLEACCTSLSHVRASARFVAQVDMTLTRQPAANVHSRQRALLLRMLVYVSAVVPQSRGGFVLAVLYSKRARMSVETAR
ncbi:hypothetical protein EON67_06615 [archaeon]|nr:MAG: hypothetical protein EON67_06615 [archaeon]